MFCFPENFKLVEGTSPVTTNGGVTSDYVSLKGVKRAWVIVQMTQAVAHATGIDVYQATAVAGTSAKALSKVVPIWLNDDCAAGDTLTRQTDAITVNVAATAKHKMAVFQIDPALLDVANGFDCINVLIDDSSQATNFASVLFVLDPIYKQSTPPTAITD